MRSAWRDAIWVGSALLVIVGCVFWIGNLLQARYNEKETTIIEPSPEHRCHSLTEDSFPFDCTYIQGEWVPK